MTKLYMFLEMIIITLIIFILYELICIIKDKKSNNKIKKSKKIITSNDKIKSEKYKEEDNINNVF